MVKNKKTSPNYHIIATHQDESNAVAKTRGHRITLNIKKVVGEAGFNTVETLLAAQEKVASAQRKLWPEPTG